MPPAGGIVGARPASAGDPGEFDQAEALATAAETAAQPPAAELHDARTDPPPGADAGEPGPDRPASDRPEDVRAFVQDKLRHLSASDISKLLRLLFSMVALRRGDWWNLPKEDADEIAGWAEQLVQDLGLEWLGLWLPRLMTGGLLAFAITERLRLDKVAAQAAANTAANTTPPKPGEEPFKPPETPL